MNRLILFALRISIVLLWIASVTIQIAVPFLASSFGLDMPEVSSRVLPYSLAAILAFVCVEVALVSLWRLLTLVARGEIFEVSSLRWVDTIVSCTLAATALTVAVFADLALVVQAGPGMYAVGLLALCGFALALILVVMRGLLRIATADRQELAVVI